MFSRFILAVKKFFMIVGIVSITIGCTVIYMKASDTSPKVSMAEMPRVKTKAEKIREMDAANSGTLLMAVVMVLCFAGGYVYLVSIRKPKPGNYPARPKPQEPLKEIRISQSEYELIEEIENEWKGRYTAQDFATLIKSTNSYTGLHQYILVNFGLEWNYEELRMIQAAVYDEKLKGKILNLTKTWVKHHLMN